MTRLYAISGPQGTGKSTILNDLEKSPAGTSIYIDGYKVSRAVQSAMGYEKLTDAYQTPAKMMVFQEKILALKYDRDSVGKSSIMMPNYLTERSFLDIAVYTAIWIAKLKGTDITWQECARMDEWYGEYFERCEKCQHIYSGIFYIERHPNVKFEANNNRADEKDSRWFDRLANPFAEEWAEDGGPHIYRVTMSDRAERVEFITKILADNKGVR